MISKLLCFDPASALYIGITPPPLQERHRQVYFKTRTRHFNYVTTYDRTYSIQLKPFHSNSFQIQIWIRNGQQTTTTLSVCIVTGIGRLNRLFEWAVYLIVVGNGTVSFWTYVERVNDVLLQMFWEFLSFFNVFFHILLMLFSVSFIAIRNLKILSTFTCIYPVSHPYKLRN